MLESRDGDKTKTFRKTSRDRDVRDRDYNPASTAVNVIKTWRPITQVTSQTYSDLYLSTSSDPDFIILFKCNFS